MSGICGYICRQDHAVQPDALTGMLAEVRRRGPDREERWSEAGAGLAIAELLPGGSDPTNPGIGDAGGRVHAIVDGLITNRDELTQELAARGRVLRGSTSQELVAVLYDEIGDSFLERIEGLYALALWDGRRSRLLLARDRLGCKPLYYHASGEWLAFGSSIRALLACGAPAEFDPQAVDDYLSSGYCAGPGTIYRDVRKLPAAHWLAADRANPAAATPRSYWDFIDPRWDAECAPALASDDRAGFIWERIERSVSRMAPAGAPAGVCLSGGPDAGALVAALHGLGREPIRTFTACFSNKSFDESPGAKVTADAFHTEHFEALVEAPDPAELAACIDAFDEPYAHPSGIALYKAGGLARGKVRYTLGGESADDLFGGNHTHVAAKYLRIYNSLPGILGRSIIPRIVRMLPVSHTQDQFEYLAKRFVDGAGLDPKAADEAWKAVISSEIKNRLRGPALRDATLEASPNRHTQPHFDRAADLPYLNRLIYGEMKVFLVDDVLYKHDRMMMAHGVEERAPYSDKRLIEFSFRLPPEDKIRGRQTKRLFRQAIADKLPASIVHERKINFNSPASEWLYRGMGDFLRETLSASRLKRHGFLDPQAVSTMIDDHLARRVDYGRHLWSALSLTLWLEGAAGCGEKGT